MSFYKHKFIKHFYSNLYNLCMYIVTVKDCPLSDWFLSSIKITGEGESVSIMPAIY